MQLITLRRGTPPADYRVAVVREGTRVVRVYHTMHGDTRDITANLDKMTMDEIQLVSDSMAAADAERDAVIAEQLRQARTKRVPATYESTLQAYYPAGHRDGD